MCTSGGLAVLVLWRLGSQASERWGLVACRGCTKANLGLDEC